MSKKKRFESLCKIIILNISLTIKWLGWGKSGPVLWTCVHLSRRTASLWLDSSPWLTAPGRLIMGWPTKTWLGTARRQAEVMRSPHTREYKSPRAPAGIRQLTHNSCRRLAHCSFENTMKVRLSWTLFVSSRTLATCLSCRSMWKVLGSLVKVFAMCDGLRYILWLFGYSIGLVTWWK